MLLFDFSNTHNNDLNELVSTLNLGKVVATDL